MAESQQIWKTPSAGDTAESLSADWWAEYRREAMSGEGDPDGFVEHVRDLAEMARPESPVHEGLALFLERLRVEDLDLELDTDQEE